MDSSSRYGTSAGCCSSSWAGSAGTAGAAATARRGGTVCPGAGPTGITAGARGRLRETVTGGGCYSC